MFTIKNMMPLTHGDLSTTRAEPSPVTQTYDAYQCDSFTLMLDPVSTRGCEKSLQLRDKENVVTHSVTVYDKCFIMNDNGKTIDTIYA